MDKIRIDGQSFPIEIWDHRYYFGPTLGQIQSAEGMGKRFCHICITKRSHYLYIDPALNVSWWLCIVCEVSAAIDMIEILEV